MSDESKFPRHRLGNWSKLVLPIQIFQTSYEKSARLALHHPYSLGDGWRLDLQRRSLGDIDAELGVELGHVVCEEGCFMAGAGNGDIAEARMSVFLGAVVSVSVAVVV